MTTEPYRRVGDGQAARADGPLWYWLQQRGLALHEVAAAAGVSVTCVRRVARRRDLDRVTLGDLVALAELTGLRACDLVPELHERIGVHAVRAATRRDVRVGARRRLTGGSDHV